MIRAVVPNYEAMVECVFDVETTYDEHLSRVGSPFAPGIIQLCSSGWLFAEEYTGNYLVGECGDGIRRGVSRQSPRWVNSMPDLTGIDVLVGHNIKFDLLWYWRHPHLEAFLARGGIIWDTAYAEYLLSGQFYNLGQPEHLRPSLANCAKRRGLTHKLDIVAALWEQGIRTEDIHEDVLMDYQQGDCITTRELYHAQLKQAATQNQLHMIYGRMEGLLATTEMEYNGLLVDLDEAAIQQAKLEKHIEALTRDLDQYIPSGLPEELEFNWGSSAHLSALLFGGSIKYKAQANILDDEGNLTYYKTKVEEPVLDAEGDPVRYKSGQNKGRIKTRKVTVSDYARGPKTRFEEFFHELPRQTQPHHAWKTETEGRWSTNAQVMEKLGERGIPLVTALLNLRQAEKDLGTYYKRFYKGKWTGMLTMVDIVNIIHHNLNHYMTLTSRLSSSKPNLQNLPKADKSEVRRLFISRFGKDGKIAEGDYSQLEVVCKGVLSEDEVLLQALIEGVCFHCDWLALSPAGEGKSYEEIFHLCKVVHDAVWTAKRSAIKPLTFGEAYGAGVNKLAEETGMTADEVQEAIANRKAKYQKMYQYDEDNISSVKRSRQVSTLRTPNGMQAGIGYLRTVTDTIYHFMETDSPEWMQHKGIMTSFSPTTIKNYPSQGLGGEIMQVQLGRLFRWVLANDRFDDKLLLINTVHDCCWFDVHNEYVHYLHEAKAIMEDVCDYFNNHYPSVQWNTPFPVEFEIGDNLYDMEPLKEAA